MKKIVVSQRDLPDRPSRPSAVEKAFIALARGAAHPIAGERGDIRDAIVGDDKVVQAILNRNAAPLGTTTDAGFAAELGQNLVGQFLTTLAPLSAAAAIIAQGLQVNLGRAVSMKLPAREGAPSATVSWVGEGAPIAVRSYELNDDCELAPRKFGFMFAMSREAAKRAGGDTVTRHIIREDAAATLDGAYFGNAAGDATTHAGMLAGVAPLAGYAGGDREAIETDLTALSDAVSAAGSGSVTFVVSPKRAARMRIVAPDLDRALIFLPSLAVDAMTIVAVDALSWAHGFGDEIDVDVSPCAALHMEDEDPLPISAPGSPATFASPVRSLYQTDSLAYRFIADLAFAARRPNAAAWLENATW